MRGMHPLQTRTQCIVVAADEELTAIPEHVQLHAAVEKEIDVAAGTAKEAVLEVNLQKKKMRIRAAAPSLSLSLTKIASLGLLGCSSLYLYMKLFTHRSP